MSCLKCNRVHSVWGRAWRLYDVIMTSYMTSCHCYCIDHKEEVKSFPYIKIYANQIIISNTRGKTIGKVLYFQNCTQYIQTWCEHSAKLKLKKNVHLWYKSVRKYTSGCRTYTILGSNWSLFHNKSIYSIAVGDFGVYNVSIIFRKWKML